VMPELGFAGRVTSSMLSAPGGLLIAGAAPTPERRAGDATARSDRPAPIFAGDDVRLVFDGSGAVVAFSSTGTTDRSTLGRDCVIAARLRRRPRIRVLGSCASHCPRQWTWWATPASARADALSPPTPGLG
jgi:hypothetical protein